jgi:ABC-type Co2+ transport system permease subunit
VSGGYALYSPYSISITVPIMCGEHALIFGVIEGLITGFAVYALLNSKSSWVLENWKITQ